MYTKEIFLVSTTSRIFISCKPLERGLKFEKNSSNKQRTFLDPSTCQSQIINNRRHVINMFPCFITLNILMRYFFMKETESDSDFYITESKVYRKGRRQFAFAEI